MEKVLILMATYNGKQYLQEQLNSLYAQIGVEITILVRDDGSTDFTQNILQENSEHHNLIWYQGEHKNVQYGFFELMQKASKMNYKYIAFCDQDDIWDENKLLIAVNQIKNYYHDKDLVLYYSGQRLVDSNLEFIANHRLNENRSIKTRFVLSDFAGCTGVFTKQLLDEVVKFKPDYMLMHDTWVLRVCICLGGKVIVDSEPRINYRQHQNNTVGLKSGILSNIKQVYLYINDYKIEKLTNELVRGYGDRMTPEYKEICKWICNYKINSKYKAKLLDKRNVDFCNKGLNLTYRIKIGINKL
ncbi:MAG: glycosyltransferase [Anaerococcus vaginalis]|nr:glycosyltransferase [Anaerococcus vaginalis]